MKIILFVMQKPTSSLQGFKNPLFRIIQFAKTRGASSSSSCSNSSSKLQSARWKLIFSTLSPSSNLSSFRWISRFSLRSSIQRANKKSSTVAAICNQRPNLPMHCLSIETCLSLAVEFVIFFSYCRNKEREKEEKSWALDEEEEGV